jgi:LacI family transcriptional regulator
VVYGSDDPGCSQPRRGCGRNGFPGGEQPARRQPKLREKVLRALKELNYRPHVRAQSFARNSSPVVSFILSNRDFLHPFHSRVLQGVEEYCEESGFFVMYTRVRYSPAAAPNDMHLPNVLQSHSIADCVILAGASYENLTKRLNKRGLNYVLLANNFVSAEAGPPYDRLRFDDFNGAAEATRYLLALGHEDIFFVGEAALPWYRNRYEGYCKAMKEAGLMPSANAGPVGQHILQWPEEYPDGARAEASLHRGSGRQR